MAIKTSANVPMKGGKTGGYDIVGQSSSKSGYGIKTSVTKPSRTNDSFYGGKPSKRGSKQVKTTGGC
jgi:hypothetical protein